MKESEHRKKARERLRRGGYKVGGHVKEKHHEDESEDKALIKKEMKRAKIKLRDGGKADGKEPKHRADRLARGGKAKGGHGKVTVNVINAHPGGARAVPVPKPVPVPVGGPPPGGPMPPGMAGPGATPMPPDQGPGPGLKRGGRAKKAKGGQTSTGRYSLPTDRVPPGHFAKGGKAKAKFPVPMSASAAGGLGRLEKGKRYGA